MLDAGFWILDHGLSYSVPFVVNSFPAGKALHSF